MNSMQTQKLIKLEGKIDDFILHIQQILIKLKTSIKERNVELLNEIIEKDEKRSNKIELRIDQYALIYIVKYEPKASALRTTISCIKINNSLERIGDHTVNIARHCKDLIDSTFVNYFNDNLIQMIDISYEMFLDAKIALETNDINLAEKIPLKDDEVNRLRDKIIQQSIIDISHNGELVGALDHIMAISRNIERIADIVTNISEDLIYKFDGRILRHHH